MEVIANESVAVLYQRNNELIVTTILTPTVAELVLVGLYFCNQKFVFVFSFFNPPTGISLSEDVDTTPSFVSTEHDEDLRVLGGLPQGVDVFQESPEKVRG